MNKRLYLYGLLFVFTLIQAVSMKHTPWFPDLILLIVVFAGIFQGYDEGIKLGLVAGLLRGSLSVYTLPLDIFLFPAVGAISAMMANRFYRQNPVVEAFITLVAIFLVIAGHTFCLKIIAGNELIGVWSVFLGSLRVVTVTTFISPLFFFFLRELKTVEE